MEIYDEWKNISHETINNQDSKTNKKCSSTLDILMKRKSFIINVLLIKNIFFNTIQDIQVIG